MVSGPHVSQSWSQRSSFQFRGSPGEPSAIRDEVMVIRPRGGSSGLYPGVLISLPKAGCLAPCLAAYSFMAPLVSVTHSAAVLNCCLFKVPLIILLVCFSEYYIYFYPAFPPVWDSWQCSQIKQKKLII